MADIDPGRVDEIREMEKSAQETAAARYAAKGETFDSLGYKRPCFFQALGALRNEEGKDGRCVPIDDVVQWSRTAHGGKQFELFSSVEPDAGCMRWGLCETSEE